MNESTTYNWIWHHIEDGMRAIESKFTKTQIQHWDFHRTYGEKTQSVIYEEYCAIRDMLKSRCYKEGLDRDAIRIDHHKIASCFCSALLNKKVFSFRINDDTPPDMLLSNYKLAYTVSLWIIYSYMIDAYLQLGDEEALHFAEILLNSKSLLPPTTTASHDQYHYGRIKTLALNEFYHIEFDLLGYADMMFWIEFYNRQKIEGKIDPRPLHDSSEITQS